MRPPHRHHHPVSPSAAGTAHRCGCATFACPGPMLDEVKREADRDGIGDSEVVRRALRYYFERDAARAPDTTRTEEIR